MSVKQPFIPLYSEKAQGVMSNEKTPLLGDRQQKQQYTGQKKVINPLMPINFSQTVPTGNFVYDLGGTVAEELERGQKRGMKTIRQAMSEGYNYQNLRNFFETQQLSNTAYRAKNPLTATNSRPRPKSTVSTDSRNTVVLEEPVAPVPKITLAGLSNNKKRGLVDYITKRNIKMGKTRKFLRTLGRRTSFLNQAGKLMEIPSTRYDTAIFKNRTNPFVDKLTKRQNSLDTKWTKRLEASNKKEKEKENQKIRNQAHKQWELNTQKVETNRNFKKKSEYALRLSAREDRKKARIAKKESNTASNATAKKNILDAFQKTKQTLPGYTGSRAQRLREGARSMGRSVMRFFKSTKTAKS